MEQNTIPDVQSVPTPPAASRLARGIAIASMIIGIDAFVLYIVPDIGAVIAIPAVVLGIVALIMAKKERVVRFLSIVAVILGAFVINNEFFKDVAFIDIILPLLGIISVSFLIFRSAQVNFAIDNWITALQLLCMAGFCEIFVINAPVLLPLSWQNGLIHIIMFFLGIGAILAVILGFNAIRKTWLRNGGKSTVFAGLTAAAVISCIVLTFCTYVLAFFFLTIIGNMQEYP